jgi:hypothetical protein
MGVCSTCCTIGAFLLDGEVLSEVPKKVKLVGKRVKNCLGRKGCRFKDPRKKPILCQMAPVVGALDCLDGHYADFTRGSLTSCGVLNNELPEWFRLRVQAVVGELRNAGIWVPGKGIRLPDLTSEEGEFFETEAVKVRMLHDAGIL